MQIASPRARGLPRGAWVVALRAALASAACARPPEAAGPAPRAEVAAAAATEGGDEGATLRVRLAPAALEAAGLRDEPATAGPARGALLAYGTLELPPSGAARVEALTDARVLRLRVAPGDRVAAGAPLVELQSLDAQRAGGEERAALERVRATGLELARVRRTVAAGAGNAREALEAEAAAHLAGVELRAVRERLRLVGAGGAAGRVVVTAPFAGRVLEVRARAGERVVGGDALVTLGASERLWLLVDVYERDLPRVREGAAATVHVRSAGEGARAASVTHVGDVIDPQRRAARVRLELANDDGALRPGASAVASIETNERADNAAAVQLPRGAVQRIDGAAYVFVPEAAEPDGARAFTARPVELGAQLGDRWEVRAGLRAGERVVTAGAFVLKSELLREQMGAND